MIEIIFRKIQCFFKGHKGMFFGTCINCSYREFSYKKRMKVDHKQFLHGYFGGKKGKIEISLRYDPLDMPVNISELYAKENNQETE